MIVGAMVGVLYMACVVAVDWTIKYQTEWCQEDEVIRDLSNLLEILNGGNDENN